jgi:hypothetical protein
MRSSLNRFLNSSVLDGVGKRIVLAHGDRGCSHPEEAEFVER